MKYIKNQSQEAKNHFLLWKENSFKINKNKRKPRHFHFVSLRKVIIVTST